jgi:hypothetical protein
MYFPISLVCSSRVSSHLLPFLTSSFPDGSWWLGISPSSFLISVVNFLLIYGIVVVSLVSKLLQGSGSMVRIFSIMWVQLRKEEYFFPHHLANPLNCVDSISQSISFHSGPCNESSTFPPLFPCYLSPHCLDGWSAGIGCVE